MMNTITHETFDYLLGEIIDTVELFEDRDEQFLALESLLVSNGIVDIIE